MINRTTIESDGAIITVHRDYEKYCGVEVEYAGEKSEVLLRHTELDHVIRMLIGHSKDWKSGKNELQ